MVCLSVFENIRMCISVDEVCALRVPVCQQDDSQWGLTYCKSRHYASRHWTFQRGGSPKAFYLYCRTTDVKKYSAASDLITWWWFNLNHITDVVVIHYRYYKKEIDGQWKLLMSLTASEIAPLWPLWKNVSKLLISWSFCPFLVILQLKECINIQATFTKS